MATYVISDIHGEYDKFKRLIDEVICLKEEDTLYVLGDVLDRGPHPMKILLEMMTMPNVIPIVGNHEKMGLGCLKFLLKEITENNLAHFETRYVEELQLWMFNGAESTIREFYQLDVSDREEIIEYLEEFELSAEVEVNGMVYWLVHGGLGGFAPEKTLDDYGIRELVWERPDYRKAYFEDRYVVTGHTPTQYIGRNPRPGYIYRENNHIAIDCGACQPSGRLAAICLETGEEFYSN